MRAAAHLVDYPTGASHAVSTPTPVRADVRDGPPELTTALGRRRRLGRGTHLFIAGDPFTSLYLVVSGSLKVYATSLDGDEQVLGFFLPHDVLALEAVSSRAHAYSAIALEDSTVAELSLERPRGEPGARRGAETHVLLQQLCCEAIAKDYAALRSRSMQFAERRLSGFLLGLWDRMSEGARARGELSLTMSRRDIGDYLGIALETVSRQLSQLEQQDVLRVRRRHLEILDPERLRQIAGSGRSVPRMKAGA